MGYRNYENALELWFGLESLHQLLQVELVVFHLLLESLHFLLKQLGLSYKVEDGLLKIVAEYTSQPEKQAEPSTKATR